MQQQLYVVKSIKRREDCRYLQRTISAEEVPALGRDRIPKRQPAYGTGKRQLLAVAVAVAVTVAVVPWPAGHCRLLGVLLPLLVQLPSGLVIASVVQKLAGVPVPAEPRLLVVLAHVRLVVEPRGRPYVCCRPERAVTALPALLPPEPGPVVPVPAHPPVQALFPFAGFGFGLAF